MHVLISAQEELCEARGCNRIHLAVMSSECYLVTQTSETLVEV